MHNGSVKRIRPFNGWLMRSVRHASCDDELLGLHILLSVRRLDPHLPSFRFFETGDFQDLKFKIYSSQDIKLPSICFEELVHRFPSDVLAVLNAESIVQWKVTEVATSPKVIGMQARIQIFLRPDTAHSFVLVVSVEFWDKYGAPCVPHRAV